MSKDLIPFLPDDLQRMTLSQLISSGDVEIVKKGDKVKITKDTSDSVLNIEYTQYPQGRTLEATQVDATGSKRSRKETVKQMRREGKTQAEIARRTGMSQAYVSNLLREDDE